ncbi:hypothetical protein LBMAG43_02640 [Methylococcaceae bacterium]|nr:hypothetical protein LBMAG43_02640 [Methylococcaceae bacterium]
MPYTFDSKNCSMQVRGGGGDDYINFVVANAGNTLYGVKRDQEFPGVERYLLTKQ